MRAPVFVLVPALLAAMPATAQTLAQAHLEALLEHAPGTPGGRGYLDVARTEAAVALRHARAAMAADTLAAVKDQTVAALHAMDPVMVNRGPGLDYGLRPALAQAVVELLRVQRTSGGDDAGALSAAAASTAAQSALTRTDEAIEAARTVLSARNVPSAKGVLVTLVDQLQAIDRGKDLNRDGEVAWNDAEGGLQQAYAFTRQMAIGEGLQVARMP